MVAPDVPLKPLLAAGTAIVLVIAVAIASVFGLLRLWDSSPGGTPLHGAQTVAAMAGAGPALQSAPQVEGDAYRLAKSRALAASKVVR